MHTKMAGDNRRRRGDIRVALERMGVNIDRSTRELRMIRTCLVGNEASIL